MGKSRLQERKVSEACGEPMHARKSNVSKAAAVSEAFGTGSGKGAFDEEAEAEEAVDSDCEPGDPMRVWVEEPAPDDDSAFAGGTAWPSQRRTFVSSHSGGRRHRVVAA